MKPICHIETPFKEKFGVPRQPLLVKEAWGKLIFPKDDYFSEAFRGIEDVSHLWLIFEFHQVEEKSFPALIRPPRFFGKKKLGVFATRSPHRINRLGLSVVEFDRLEVTVDEIILWVRGVDLVSGTPVFDIKPYIPYCDSIPHAHALNFERPEISPVVWRCDREISKEVEALIEKVIGLDPRPGHESDSSGEFGVSVGGWNVVFQISAGVASILTITKECT